MAAGKHPAAWTRPLRRIWRPFLDKTEKTRIQALIDELETKTTGEIHVRVVGRAGGKDVLELARETFAKLGLDRTERRNGVLILISHLDHRFAIWGDAGIHEKAGHPLWTKARETLLSHFKERRYPEGLEACVREVGRELAAHFPRKGGAPAAGGRSDEVTEEAPGAPAAEGGLSAGMKVDLVKQYSVFMPNTPGSLARLAELFLHRGVNLIGVASEVRDDTGVVRIAVGADVDCSEVLSRAGFSCVESKVLSIELSDKPGQLHRMARLLADGGVNITTVYGTALGGQKSCRILFAVDDSRKALALLRRAA